MFIYILINKIKKILNRKGKLDLRSYKYNTFVELTEAGYLILLLTSLMNL